MKSTIWKPFLIFIPFILSLSAFASCSDSDSDSDSGSGGAKPSILIATGGSHTCAVYNGAAKCWGANGSGRLGNNSIHDSNVPVDGMG